MTNRLLNQTWWKILGVILIVYTVVAGLGVPLKPGIIDMDSIRASGGESKSIDISCYNCDFAANKDDLQAWLKTDPDLIVAARSAEARNARQLRATFDVPAKSPHDNEADLVTLIVQIGDETVQYPDALFINYPDSAAESSAVWAKAEDIFPIKKDFRFPFRNILEETIRNTYFHVALWFAMFFMLIASVIYAIRFLVTRNVRYDFASNALTSGGLVFGLMGFATGMLWAKYTWGSYWPQDVKLNMTAIALLIYAAYFILRSSMGDEDRARTVGAVYNIFAFSTLIPLIFIIPRLTDSLHPGNGGNPALGAEDMDNIMRMVFYPAILGWTLLGFWMSSLKYRLFAVEEKLKS